MGPRDEEGYTGSYSTAQRYVKRRREEMARERDRRDAEGFPTPRWLPGEVQVDFGEADFRVRGAVARGKYLAVAFPHSDVGLTQVFWGETAECVCQGLRDVFEFVGGVPGRAVFDNATEVGTVKILAHFPTAHGPASGTATPPTASRPGSASSPTRSPRRA